MRRPPDSSHTSVAQAGRWVLDRLIPDPRAHRLHRAYDVLGALDLGALASAWRAVQLRHDILRTRLVEADGEPVPLVSPSPDTSATLVELGHLPATGREAAVLDRASMEWIAAPLDLATGPVSRLVVVRRSATEHRLLLVAHRAAADESSMSILVRDLAEAYQSAVGGSAPAPVAAPAQSVAAPARYANWARWQRNRLAGGGFAPLLRWWTSTLTPLPQPDALGADRTPPIGPAFDGGLLRFDWASTLGGSLAELSGRTGTAPELIPLAGLLCLLHRYGAADQRSDPQRVAVCVPIPARSGPGSGELVGPFTNQVVLSVDMSRIRTFRALLTDLAGQARDAFARAELPFDLLSRALQLGRDPRRHPICDVWYRFPDRSRSELRLPDATVRPAPVHTGFVEADLVLSVDRVTPAVAGTLAYRDARFDRETARLLLDQLHTLLAAASAGLGLPVGELPLEPARPAGAALGRAGEPPAGPPAEPVHRQVRHWARRTPYAPAVAWPGPGLSYRELDEHADRIAAGLRRLGAGVGTAVAVSVDPGPRQVAALLGVGYAGAQLVCVDSGTGERARTVLADLRPVCLVLDGERAGDPLAAWYRERLDGQVLDLALPYPEPGVARGPGGSVESGSQDVAYVAYTSGSTGRPKGIPQRHGTLAQFVGWFSGQFGIGAGSRLAQWAAAGYDASLCEVFAALGAGATLCPVPGELRMHPAKLLGWLAEERITHLQTVPSFARELLRVIRRDQPTPPLAALRWLLLAGEVLPAGLANDLRRALPGVRLANLYGPTESILATWFEVDSDLDRTAPIGRPIPGRRVVVMDETDRPCPTGVIGEIVIVSPYLTTGYLGAGSDGHTPFRPLRDPAVVAAGGERVYRTGDLGRWRPDGLLEFRGRRDLQVKFYGTRVELTDIEAALAAHDSVAECVVVALTDRHGLVFRLVAYVVPARAADGRVAGEPVWRQHLHRRLGRSRLPVAFRTVGALPRNTGGKLDRRALAAAAPVVGDDGAPQSPVEQAVAAIWSELAGADQVSRSDTFFSVGGHSLLAPRAVTRIRERLGVEVTLWEFFASPSLGDLSALIESALRSG